MNIDIVLHCILFLFVLLCLATSMSGSNSSSYQSNFSSNQNSSSSSGDQFGFGGEEQKVVLTFAGSGGGATGPNVKSSRSFSARLAHNLYNEGGVDLGIDGRRPAIRKDDGSEFTAEEAKRKAEEEINQHVKVRLYYLPLSHVTVRSLELSTTFNCFLYYCLSAS